MVSYNDTASVGTASVQARLVALRCAMTQGSSRCVYCVGSVRVWAYRHV